MTDLTSYLCRLTDEAIAIFFRAAPGFESHVTAEGCLVLTGEPSADANAMTIWGGPAPEERLREFGARLEQRQLPCLMFTTTEQSESLAPVVRSYGFSYVGMVPLMALEPEGDVSARDDYTTEIVTTATAHAEWVSPFFALVRPALRDRQPWLGPVGSRRTRSRRLPGAERRRTGVDGDNHSGGQVRWNLHDGHASRASTEGRRLRGPGARDQLSPLAGWASVLPDRDRPGPAALPQAGIPNAGRATGLGARALDPGAGVRDRS